MEKLILIANLGRLRILKFREAGDDPRQKPHLIEAPGSPLEMRPKFIREVVTDKAGRFSQSGSTDRLTGMSYGEEHELESQLDKQALDNIAEKIDETLAAEGYPLWRLMANQGILGSLQAALPAAARQSLAYAEAGDLTRMPVAELEKRLLEHA